MVDHLKLVLSTLVDFTMSSTPLFDMLPIGKNWREKPVLVASGRKNSRSETTRL